jgi:hypothetical protein
MADNAANDADDAMAAAAAANNDALPRSMLLIKEAKGGEGDDNDAPIALLLARFIQNFAFGLMDPSSLPSSWFGGWGNMNRKSPGGVPMVTEKG